MFPRLLENELQVHNESNVQAPIFGDVLETILSHVPLIDLVFASRVAKSWSHAVISSLKNFNKPKPWLIVYCRATRAPYLTSTYGYDPRSNVWIEISRPSKQFTSDLRVSNSNFLYMISPSRFSFSHDSLHINWHHLDAPHVWRVDPIVALVENIIIVAGGTCDFEDDPLAVELYDIESNTWRTSISMPETLKQSASSTWLSSAVVNNKLFVMEKSSGVTHSFDPKTEKWSEPFTLLPDDQRIFYSELGFANNRLISIGLIGTVENLERVKIFKIGIDEHVSCEEMGEIPLEHVEKLKSETFGISSLNICMAGDLVYLWNESATEEVVVGEVVEGGDWRWWSVKNEACSDRSMMERMVFTCAEVGVDELRRVMGGARRFTVKGGELTRLRSLLASM